MKQKWHFLGPITTLPAILALFLDNKHHVLHRDPLLIFISVFIKKPCWLFLSYCNLNTQGGGGWLWNYIFKVENFSSGGNSWAVGKILLTICRWWGPAEGLMLWSIPLLHTWSTPVPNWCQRSKKHSRKGCWNILGKKITQVLNTV